LCSLLHWPVAARTLAILGGMVLSRARSPASLSVVFLKSRFRRNLTTFLIFQSILKCKILQALFWAGVFADCTGHPDGPEPSIIPLILTVVLLACMKRIIGIGAGVFGIGILVLIGTLGIRLVWSRIGVRFSQVVVGRRMCGF